MNPKIKEALSCEFQKDEETERICTFIADFIKDYSYHLTCNNIVKINCRYFFKGHRHECRLLKEDEIEFYIPGTKISRKITTTFSKGFFVNLLRKESASVTEVQTLGSFPYDNLEITFKRQ